MRKIIASLDIGSYETKLVVGEIYKNRMHILAVSETPTKGVVNGLVSNEEALLTSLKEVFKRVEEMLNLRVRKVILAVPSYDTEFAVNVGKTAIQNEEQIVTSKDIVDSMQVSVKNTVAPNMELVSVIPTGFKINDTEIVKNPLNTHAETLSVKSVIISVPKVNVIPFVDALEKIGVEVFDVSLTSIGDYYAFRTEEMKEAVGAIINIGKDTTTLSIFNRGILTNTEVLKLGSKNIDNDLAYVYKIPIQEAKYIKEKIALAHKRMADASMTYTLTNKEGESVTVNQYEVTEIVESRLGEILNIAKKEINLLTKKEIHYIILTGGNSSLQDLNMLLDTIWNGKVTIGNLKCIGARENKFSSAVGLIKYYHDKMKLRNKEFSIFTLEEMEELMGSKKMNISENSVLGKLFGYFFDN